MKRLTKLSCLLLAAIVISLCLFVSPTKANAATSGYYTYTVSGGKATITAVDYSVSGKVTIPSKLGGYPVTAIADSVFAWNSSVTSITIPSSVTSIGVGVFEHCSGLTSVTISKGVKSIGYAAFYGCSSLTSVTIPSSVTSIGDAPFVYCSSLKAIYVDSNNPNYSNDARGVLFNKNKTKLIEAPGGIQGNYSVPNSVTAISDNAFYDCGSLINITIPDSVTSIGGGAFMYCTSLTNTAIPKGVTRISEFTFYGCESMTGMMLPKSVTSIGENAFSGCDSLRDIYYAGSQSQWNKISIATANDELKSATKHYECSGVFVDPSKYPQSSHNYSSYADETKTFTWPNARKLIITFSSSTYVERGFDYIYLYDGSGNLIAAYTGSDAAGRTVEITGNTFRVKLTSDDGYEYYGYSFSSIVAQMPKTETGTCGPNLKWTLEPSGTLTISGTGSMDGYICDHWVTDAPWEIHKDYITKVVIKSGVTSIGSNAFFNCRNLTSVTIPDSVTSICRSAFACCYSLSGVTLPSKIVSIDAFVFESCYSLTSIAIPNSITLIEPNTFYSCYNMTSVFIPKSVTIIDEEAFAGCDALADVYYGGNQTQWNDVYIGLYNTQLSNANFYYNAFPDVKNNAWYFRAVNFAVEKGYFSGNGDGTFAPGKNITRQDFVVVLSRIAGANLSLYSGITNFTDVPSGAYYAKAIHWATDNGIISGYNATKFGVGDPLTREQLVTILSRYAQKKGVNVTPNSAALNKMNTYSDASKINPYMKNAIAWALYNKVISGMTDTTIVPQGNATRSQVAAILMNINAYKVIPGI